MSVAGQPTSLSEQASKITAFLNTFITAGHLDLQFREPQASAGIENPSVVPPVFTLEFTGSDTPILTARNGEVLHALEYMAARILGLDSTQHELLSFDADHFKLNRLRDLEQTAAAGVERVRATGQRFAFPPMSSRERRTLHMLLAASGLPTGSIGENPRRYVILYPEGQRPAEPGRPNTADDLGNSATSDSAAPASPDRTRAIRNTFRRR